uniref:Uncharacterized protein n=1 Tax=Glossina palpalis gambiensis TaxID=67801 RepID=A0A1B0ALB4_9MUSC
ALVLFYLYNFLKRYLCARSFFLQFSGNNVQLLKMASANPRLQNEIVRRLLQTGKVTPLEEVYKAVRSFCETDSEKSSIGSWGRTSQTYQVTTMMNKKIGLGRATATAVMCAAVVVVPVGVAVGAPNRGNAKGAKADDQEAPKRRNKSPLSPPISQQRYIFRFFKFLFICGTLGKKYEDQEFTRTLGEVVNLGTVDLTFPSLRQNSDNLIL